MPPCSRLTAAFYFLTSTKIENPPEFRGTSAQRGKMSELAASLSLVFVLLDHLLRYLTRAKIWGFTSRKCQVF